METIWIQLRQASRRLVRAPQHTLLIVLCLTLGIGANTVIFTIVNNILLRPLPIPEVDRVGTILDMREGRDPFDVAAVNYLILKEEGTSFASVGMTDITFVNLTGGDRPERVQVASMTYDYLETLAIQPLHGRLVSAAEDVPGAPDVVLIGHDLWQRRFGGDSGVVGQDVLIEGRSHKILGVLPRHYDQPGGTQMWIPLRADFRAMPLGELTSHHFLFAARLKPGVTFEQAAEEVKALSLRLQERYPDDRSGWEMRLLPLRYQLLNDFEGTTGRALFLILSVVGFLLLIACANVASLLLVRTAERSHELAMHSALGAGRGRLFAQVILESMLLSLLGGAGGLLVAYLMLPIVSTLAPVNFQTFRGFYMDVPIDGNVLLFTLGATALTGLLFGLVPALRVTATKDLAAVLQAGTQRTTASRGGQRLLKALVVGEVAVAMILLIGADLMIKSFKRHLETDLGYEIDNRLVFEVYLGEDRYDEHPKRVAYVDQVLERVRGLPGVIEAGITTDLPLSVGTWDSYYEVEGKIEADRSKVPITGHRRITAGYPQALGMRLVEGRLINEQDQAGSQMVAVISRDMAEHEWPGESALDKRLRRISRGQPLDWMTVVGVVESTKEERYQFYVDRPAWYLPYSQHPNNNELWLVIHTDGEPRKLVEAVRHEIWAVDPDQPIARITTMEEHLSEYFGQQRFSAYLTGLFAFLGLVLAAMGLYGLMSHAVTQRVREIGIRIAFGARPGDLLKMVVGSGMLMAVAGLVLGILGALGLTRLFSSLLYEVDPANPVAYGVIAAILLAVALVAVLVPATRAMGRSPVTALRKE